MKNYQLKLILAFFIIGSIIIVGFGLVLGTEYDLLGTSYFLYCYGYFYSKENNRANV